MPAAVVTSKNTLYFYLTARSLDVARKLSQSIAKPKSPVHKTLPFPSFVADRVSLRRSGRRTAQSDAVRAAILDNDDKVCSIEGVR